MSTPRKISFRQACNQYVHRYTMEHKPAWANKPHKGRFYAPQYRSDREWYDLTLFPGEGHLSPRSKHCESNNQTWPLGQWLDQAYQIGEQQNHGQSPEFVPVVAQRNA